MRPILKGGQWKNSEDEVLKAAVMKYGMNNWSRVASLLNRKTARQCRARWYEWLDPFVKKTPWSQQEDEKLLHAVKVFPTQWKTIAPIVGRTAYQCVARYNELLDIAAGGEPIAPENDPRLPKPGEIDAQPETRPAKADAVDLDDDEREMLAEARARLANTKGKKAKRKAREKQLEQKRRSVMVQRRKEFEEAGITLKPRRSRGSNVDYNTVIPNQMTPLPGAHDVSGEQTLSQEQEALHKRLRDIEVAKERLRQQKLRADERRLLKRIHPNTQEPSSLVDIFSIKQRSALTLPAPQATDSELLSIAEVAKSQGTARFFSDALAQSTSVKPSMATDDGQTHNLFATQMNATSQTVQKRTNVASSYAPTDLQELNRNVEPLNLAELLGDMNLYIGSKYSVQMAVDELEAAESTIHEIDAENQATWEVQNRVRQLSQIYRRYKIFVERLPRPMKLPPTVEDIVELLERNSKPQNKVEADLNIQAAELMLADQLFLDPSEYHKLFSSDETSSNDTIEKLKATFLLHAHKTSGSKNLKFLKQAVIELDECLDEYSSQTPTLNPKPHKKTSESRAAGGGGSSGARDESHDNPDAEDQSEDSGDSFEEMEEPTSDQIINENTEEFYNQLRTHISLKVLSERPANSSSWKVCVWNPKERVNEFVSFDHPLVETALQNELEYLQKATKAFDKKTGKCVKKLEKLTLGYKSRVEEAVKNLDRVYQYNLEQFRNSVEPVLPPPTKQLQSLM